MSKHIITLPIDIGPVLNALPEKSHVHSVTMRPDRTGIEIIWENDDLYTGRTYPVEYPVEKLEATQPKAAGKKKYLWPFAQKQLTSN